MTLSKRNLVLIIAAIAVAAGAHLTTVAVGQEGGGSRPPRHDNVMVRWLGLEGEAAEIVAEQAQAFRREIRQLQRRVEIEQLELATMFESDDATEADLREQFDKLAAAHLAVHKRVADHVLAIRPHLDADQRARLNEFMARQIRGGKGGRSGPEGPGERGPGGMGPGGDEGPPPHEGMRRPREGMRHPPMRPDRDGPPPMHEDPEPGE